MTTDKKILSFLKGLDLQARLPKGIESMNPYQNEYTFSLCQKFYQLYFHDKNPRTLLLGINPGRFGSGITGVSFTDPVKLAEICGIENKFEKRTELSADFIYRMIGAYGGPTAFYKRYFISAISPLGFTQHGKNINYYDDKKLEKAVTPFIVQSIHQLMEMGSNRNVCYCIGEGKNHGFLKALNEKHRWFRRITPLAHPRFIMQYKRKQLDQYIDQYVKVLSE